MLHNHGLPAQVILCTPYKLAVNYYYYLVD